MSEQRLLFGISQEELSPLAHKSRPKSLEEFIGQYHLLGNPTLEGDKIENNALRKAIKNDLLGSIILFGPAGCGKTSLAKIVASYSDSHFEELNATQCSVSDIRELSRKAAKHLEEGRKTTLFIDEIHRFSKSQQDSLLNYVETGLIRLIGATTENPFFSITSALISRCTLLELKALQAEEIQEILQKAITKKLPNIEISKECLEIISLKCSGDPRIALNALELASQLAEPNTITQKRSIGLEEISQAFQKNIPKYDKTGDNHYDQISAFIKSMRGSDPDASLYWLARLIESGEDPRYIARRIVIHAAEDVGLADPSVLQTALAAQQALEFLGMPEAKIPMAMACLHIALAPKSNSACAGIKKATDFVINSANGYAPVPDHLRDSHYQGAEILGRGKGYLYPHNFPNTTVNQEYFPKECGKPNLYNPSNSGVEKQLNQNISKKDK